MTMAGRNNPTMAQIADLAGVSRVTVSNVLNGRTEGAWAKTRRQAARIHRIAEQLGYRPNAAAKATASGRFNTAAMISRANVGSLQWPVDRGAMEALEERGMHMIRADVDESRMYLGLGGQGAAYVDVVPDRK